MSNQPIFTHNDTSNHAIVTNYDMSNRVFIQQNNVHMEHQRDSPEAFAREFDPFSTSMALGILILVIWALKIAMERIDVGLSANALPACLYLTSALGVFIVIILRAEWGGIQ